ncbi:cysteine-rich repeat secretory protein 38-like [Quercus suber]|uniref:cysteine-rich repeat secretory protein 38-like n=1 Tax=Quercus suber TaxID=58331 RepID=UPI0032DF427E
MSLMYNTQNTTSPELTNLYALGLLYDLIDRAKVTDMLFKSDSQTVKLSDGSKISYGLVQCTRDIDGPSCGQCLSYLMGTAETCCQAKIGWRILGPSCFLRYENYSFTDQSPAKPLPLPPAQSMPAATLPPTVNGPPSAALVHAPFQSKERYCKMGLFSSTTSTEKGCSPFSAK